MGSPGWTSDQVQQILNWNGEVKPHCLSVRIYHTCACRDGTLYLNE